MRLGLTKVHGKEMREKKESWEGYGEKKKMPKEERKYIEFQECAYICGSSSSHCLTSLEQIRSSLHGHMNDK